MDNLRTRHAATLATLNSQIEYLHKGIATERRQAEKLRDTLDELSEDISREAYGRRREVGLRLAFLAREEGLAENLRRWLRRSKESLDRLSPEGDQVDASLREAFAHMLDDAEELLESLNGQPSAGADSPVSLARVVAAQDAVATLTKELHIESDRRLSLQRRLAQVEFSEHPDPEGPFTLTAPPPRHASLGRASQERLKASIGIPIEPVTQIIDETPIVSLSANVRSPQELNPIPANGVAVTGTVDQDTSIPTFTTVSLPESPAEQSPRALETVMPAVASSDNGEDADLALGEESIASRNIAPEVVRNLSSKDGVLSRAVSNDSLSQPATSSTASTSSSSPTVSAAILPPESNLGVLSPANDSQQPPPLNPTIPPLDNVVEALTDSVEDTAVPAPIDFPQASEALEHDESLPRQSDPSSLLFSTSSSDAPLASGKDDQLARLSQVKHRYQHLQKSFSDCNVTLKDLKRELNSLPPSVDMTSVIRIAVERLDDFNEDARVELEIRIADEERIVVGYETLLSVPGSLDDDMDEGKLQDDIETFINGSNNAVARATQQFTRKLGDLEHDIAAVKRAIYELADSASAAVPTTPPRQNQGWSSWTAGILGTQRPVSPAPTFGSVMTTPRARLASFSRSPRSDPDTDDSPGPFASLGLRIAMPAHVATPPRPFLSPVGSVARGPRPRVSSTSLFALGLGARSSSFTFASPGSSKSPSSGLARGARDASEDSDSDIE